MASRDELSYWLAIKEGDYVSLSDYQSFAEGGADGLDYTVGDIRAIQIHDQTDENVIAEYRLYELERSGSSKHYLMVFHAGDEFELRVYYQPDGFMEGSRDHQIDNGHTWFFLPPENPDDFISSQLEYAPFPDVPPIEENGAVMKREFSMAGFGAPAYGAYTRRDREIPIILVEYHSDDPDAINPHLLILEEHWIGPDGKVPESGGFITLLLGSTLPPESAEVYPG